MWIRDSNKFSLIHKLYRDYFLKLIETNENIITGGNGKHYLSLSRDSIIRHIELNPNNFEEKKFEDDFSKNRIHLLLIKINSLICFNTVFIGKD